MNVFIWIVIALVLAIILYFFYRKNFKILKVPSVCLITGGVKCGKSLLSVKLSIKDFKKRHRRWWFFRHILRDKLKEEPMYYTNVQISFGSIKSKKPHRLDRCIKLVTLDSLLRMERYNYKSVIYIQEASLMSDNMDFNNKVRNVELSLYAKLIAHETRGGAMYVDTQSVLDVHYAFKRVASTYFFIQKNMNFLLFHILYVREMINQENGVNSFVDDVDTTTRKVLIPFWYHHKYNRYEYSYLTDDLKVSDERNVKHHGVVSFNPLYTEHADKRIKDEPKPVEAAQENNNDQIQEESKENQEE